MEGMEELKASVEVNSTGASTNASAKASITSMEAFAEVMESSMKVTSMEA